jgi:two-component system sensor histidine kinase KdpD
LEEEVPATPDQVMVCLSSKGQNSEKLLRYASRLAGRLNRNWYAVYVQTPSEAPTAIDAQTQRILSGTLTLAKQLGAIVFTFKGEDIVKTILQFAREYRVGHIVIGSPRKIPFWKQLLGERSVAERLIHDARGVTVVVLDTQKPDVAAPLAVEEEMTQEGEVPAIRGAEEARTRLTQFISQERVIIWETPITKDDILRSLSEVACEDGNEEKLKGLNAIMERERQGSTFFNEGVAFPHARIEGLKRSCVAIGLTHGGLSDVTTEKPIESVFLIFSPADVPDEQIQILGLVSKAALDRQLMETLRSAKTPGEAYQAIRAWEIADRTG